MKVDHKIMLHSRKVEGAKDIYSLKSTLKPRQTVIILIGPEGGFSAEEVELAQKNDIDICYLNLPILRTETAGIIASGILLS